MHRSIFFLFVVFVSLIFSTLFMHVYCVRENVEIYVTVKTGTKEALDSLSFTYFVAVGSKYVFVDVDTS